MKVLEAVEEESDGVYFPKNYKMKIKDVGSNRNEENSDIANKLQSIFSK